METSDLQKRVKDLRTKQGLSQEALSGKTGLSLRTIQRIEKGESTPRGDTLNRISKVLQTSTDELAGWTISDDKSVVRVMNLSQLGFLAFPLLEAIIPLFIWLSKRDKSKSVDRVGKLILNYQITWLIALVVLFIVLFFGKIQSSVIPFVRIYIGLYIYNVLNIGFNAILIHKTNRVKYIPSIKFLR